MKPRVEFKRDSASASVMARHFRNCDEDYQPRLSSRVDVDSYACKLAQCASLFEAWVGDDLVGLVAVYYDRALLKAFVSNVSVVAAHRSCGIASCLLESSVARARELALDSVELEVSPANLAAHSLYRRHGFQPAAEGGGLRLVLKLSGTAPTTDPSMPNNTRDYNAEFKDNSERKYAYNFDFDVMHRYMVRSFETFFRPGSLLELGSFKGDFTSRLLRHFQDITCVEVAEEALEEAKARLGGHVKFVQGSFETVALPQRYDTIVMTHVLEHVDEPCRVLRRVNDEWLADGGRFLLVCPNANAPSRQIAVKMGLISHNSAVTPAEAAHGHHRTYTMDTLEQDAAAAGLKVVHRSGIFFKALANFQWDLLLKTDIISEGYLEGCYALGQLYPDLCASIFLVCERGHPVR